MRKPVLLQAFCLAPVLLSGCDLSGLFPAADAPTVVIPAGYVIEAGGRRVHVAGLDECPRQEGVSEPAAGADGHGCIVLTGDRSEVPVRVYLPSGTVSETWTVRREAWNGAGTVTLLRPDGTPVTAASR